MSNLLEIRDLVVDYLVRDGIIRTVDHVFLNLKEREVLGLVGESGCGKTSLVQAITMVIPYNCRIRQGKMIFKGKNLFKISSEELRKLRWEKIAQVFQSVQSALNPFFTVEKQFIETVEAHRDTLTEEMKERFGELLKLVKLDPKILKFYPHQLSGGMKQRVGIAMSLLFEPELLILDEPVSALDLTTQTIINNLLKELHEKIKNTLLYVTHDIAALAGLADRMAIMYGGKIVEISSAKKFFSGKALHPYSRALQSMILSVDSDFKNMTKIPGTAPSLLLHLKPKGCVFHPRCPLRAKKCETVEPKLIKIDSQSSVACHHA